MYPDLPDGPRPWHWDQLAEQGLWSTIEAPEGSVAAAAVVVEELGRALYPGPAADALAATYLTQRAGLSSSGNLVVLAAASGPLVRVPEGTDVLVTTKSGDLLTLPAPPLTDAATLDVTRDLGLLGPVVGEKLSAEPELVYRARAVRAMLYCADTLGCVDRVIERAAEYANQRTTFGVPIGKYQAVAHRLVDHAVTARQLRLLLDAAITAIDGALEFALPVATAETLFTAHALEIVSDCIQLAGAIGFTWEFGHHFYARRVLANTALCGVGRPQRRLAGAAAW